MGLGIQIKKPEHASVEADTAIGASAPTTFPPLYYLLLLLTFPAALVALYFFFQTRTV